MKTVMLYHLNWITVVSLQVYCAVVQEQNCSAVHAFANLFAQIHTEIPMLLCYLCSLLLGCCNCTLCLMMLIFCIWHKKKHSERPSSLPGNWNFRFFKEILKSAFFYRRNILPEMNDAYLRNCHRGNDSLCPIFRLGDIVREAGERFSEMSVEVS